MSMTLEELIRLAYGEPLSRDEYEEVAPRNYGKIVDAIAHMKRNPHSYTYKMPTEYSVHDQIHRCLGFIPHSERDSTLRGAAVESYVFPSSVEDDEDVVNVSSETTQAFIDTVIETAKRQAREVNDDAAYASVDSHFFLHGGRGVGKTSWLHYALAVNREYFDDEGIVWIKLNAHDSIDFENEARILDFVLAQMLKVLLRYYCKRSEYFPSDTNRIDLDLSAGLQEYIEKEYKEGSKTREILELRLASLIRAYQVKGVGEPVDVNETTTLLGREARLIAHKKGYKFVVILDGVDQLEATRDSIKKYSKLCHEIRQLNSLGRNGITWITVGRSASIGSIARPNDDAGRRGQAITKRIVAVDLKDVLFARKSVIERIVGAKFGNNVVVLQQPLSGFLTTFFRDIRYQQLKSIFGNNMRAQIQGVQLLYHHYTESRLSHAISYHFIEQIMTMGRSIPPVHYDYRCNERGELIRTRSDGLSFDNRFMPSVFDFPTPQNGDSFGGT